MIVDVAYRKQILKRLDGMSLFVTEARTAILSND